MKQSLLMILISSMLFVACKKDSATDDTQNPAGVNSNYNFYISQSACGVVDNIVKNFTEVINPKSSQFNVIGTNVYTFGSKKYRNGGVISTYDYSGYIDKNNSVLYSNVGGAGSYIFNAVEANSSLYFVTGFNSIQGVVSATSVNCIPKVWKDGVVIDSLYGPFNNTSQVNGVTITSRGFGIDITGLIVKDGNVYVSGVCDDFNSDKISFGYWKNNTYTELYRYTSPLYTTYLSKLSITDNGDIYFYAGSRAGNFLYKNGTNILNSNLSSIGLFNFTILNNNVYVMGTAYENGGYKLKLYKNGILENTTSIHYGLNPSNASLYSFDGKIFVVTSVDGSFISVFEFNETSKTLDKIGATSVDMQGCGAINVLNFQVTKK